MKKLIIILIIANLGTIKAQKTVGGVTMPKKVMIGKTVLNLNGAGVREKYWIDMYACALYLKKRTNDATQIINNNDYASLKLQIISGLISSKKMSAAVEEGFEKSSSDKLQTLRKRIDQFKKVFSQDEIKKGDIYDIIYVPQKGTIIFKNGKVMPTIKGLDFKIALFKIWLGDKPADKDLKENLLNN